MQTANSVLQRVVSPQQKHVSVPESNRASSTNPSHDTSTTANTPQLTADDMDLVFDAMGQLYGNKFSSQWGAFDADGAWLAELGHLTRQHVESGIGRLRQQVRAMARDGSEAWPPQPLAFTALCEPRPSDLGLPDVADAWREACAGAHSPAGRRWSHEAVRLAGQAVGWWELMHVQPSRLSRLESRFAREYQALVNRVMAGEDLTPRHLLESDSQRTPAELAERAGREAVQRQAEEAGLPQRMSASQGLAMLKTAAGRV